MPTVIHTFPILNMSCASCAVSVETMLAAQPGVTQAGVNYATATAQVVYDPEVINDNQLRQAVQSIGYDLLLPEQAAHTSAEDLHRLQYKALQRKTGLAIILSIPLVFVGMLGMGLPYANYIMWALATPVMVIPGRQFFRNAFLQATHGRANMDTLVAVSTGVSYLFSVFNTLYPAYWHHRGLHAHVYFEAAAVVIAFILVGKLLEEKAKNNTSSAIKKLMGLQPNTVTIIAPDGKQEEVSVSTVIPGQELLVKPGEKIAVDGRVSGGSSYVDESLVSGESIPVLKQPGDTVLAGTLNQKGSFRFIAEKVGAATLLGQIIAMVQQAQGSKAPVQQLVDKIAGVFVPVVIGLALLSGIVWVVAGGDNGIAQGLLAMITVLVIACPCALGLATPTAIITGIGLAAEKGILVKDAESLQRARHINAVVLDKTGTLTQGQPEVTGIYWAAPANQEWLPVLAALEKQSEHPLAAAVWQYAGAGSALPVTHFESITGKGVKAMIKGDTWYAGNQALLQQYGIATADALTAQAATWLAEAKTVIYFANSSQALAVVAIADSIRPTSAAAVAQLQQQGIEVYMLTGDNEATARAVAAATGITHYKAGILPADKAAFVQRLQQQGKVVAMAGDGINDSNALAQADVSIAMGQGSDIAMDVAAMTIISSDLARLPEAIRLSARTVRTIRQNLFWAFIYNITGIPIAAGALYPVNGFLLNPMLAGGAMALSSVSVVLNSLRLKINK